MIFSSWDIFSRVLDNPRGYDLATTDVRKNGGKVWVDHIHPTTKIHDIFAYDLVSWLNVQSAHGADATGLVLGDHAPFMKAALLEAQKCEPSPTAFNVGCVITVRWPSASDQQRVLSVGYSRELPGNTHAEANALAKARELSSDALKAMFPTSAEPPKVDELLQIADVYTTMEPCSVRTSGLAPCADALIAAKIRRCFIGVGEPDDYVVCEGATKLQDAGIEVIWLKGLEQECLEEARRK